MNNLSPRQISSYVLDHGIRRARLGVRDWDLQTDQCAYSDSWFEMLGYRPGEIEQTSDLWMRLTHPDDLEVAQESGDRHLRGETSEIETELRLRHKDGRWIWVLDRGGVVERDSHGRPTRMIGMQADITRQKTAEIELQGLNERFRIALDATDVGIWEFDHGTDKSYWDERTCRIFGLAEQRGPGDDWHAFLHPDDQASAVLAHEAVSENTSEIPYRIIRKDGEVRHVTSLARLVTAPGRSDRVVGTIRDVTEQVNRTQALAWAATHDSLTGLLNRAEFERLVEKQLSRRRAGCDLAVLYIDLDYFKAVNDAGGHAAGDTALCEAATVLSVLGSVGCVARLGGDEFAVSGEWSRSEAERLARTIIDAIGNTETAKRLHVDLGASVGIAFLDESCRTVSDFIARADDACFAAKARGRNGWAMFGESGLESSGLTAARLVSDMADAKHERRLVLFGQEIRSVASPHNRAEHIEVLTRMFTREGGIVMPGQFISAAERFGMAAALDRWVITSALEDFAQVLEGRALAFNLSAQTISDATFWSFVEDAVGRSGTDPSCVWFELTETAAMTNTSAARSFMRSARSGGFKLALDDFGKGLSSFGYLRDFEIDCLKIDGSIVSNLRTSKLDRKIVSCLRDISTELGCELIAECVEDTETLRILVDEGVDLAQGYFLHRPEELGSVLERGRRDRVEPVPRRA